MSLWQVLRTAGPLGDLRPEGLGHREQEEGVVWGKCAEVGLGLSRQPLRAYVKVMALRPLERISRRKHATDYLEDSECSIQVLFLLAGLTTEGLSIAILNFLICI